MARKPPPPDEEQQQPSFSRRSFLKSAGVSAAATTLVGASANASAAPTALGPDAVTLNLKVNGAARSVTVEPRVTLLDALRNQLDLTGAKPVCERGGCGACTVLLDGAPIVSCLLLAADAEGHEITTVEGLGSPEKLSPLQAAFVEKDALQCGFCTPGQIVRAAALLVEKWPDDAAARETFVRHRLSGNICRCTGYNGIIDAIWATAEKRRAAREAA